MNKNKYLLVFILLLCLIPNVAKAATLIMTDYEVTVRKGPGTNYDYWGKTGPTGSEYPLKKTDLTKTEKGCNTGYWYNVEFNNIY